MSETMSRNLVVTGTDTGIGKTIFCAALTQALGATYWKPVQSGLEEETDSDVVSQLSGCTVLPEAYRLALPASPHLSAEAEGVTIDIEAMKPPEAPNRLIIEGAGGLMVPLDRQTLFLELFQRWQVPVILCARTSLGTINHTLLSLKALEAAKCPVFGIAFIGDAEPDVEATICDFGNVKRLGRLPFLDELTQKTLKAAFEDGFDQDAFHTYDEGAA